jgi:hypothetical protein
MIFRKDARKMAAALDKARELSREEPAADWSEAEWKKLMAAAVAQKMEGKEKPKEPSPKAAYWRPVLAYGGAALIMVALIGYALRSRILKPLAGPVPSAQVIVQKDEASAAPAIEAERPKIIGGIAKPSETDALKPAPPVPSVIHARKAALGGRAKEVAVPVESPAQDMVTVRLVSPETGLRIVWVLNRNFKWKGEGL